MRHTTLIFSLVVGAVLFTACQVKRGVDETVETDSYSLRIQSRDMIEDDVVSYYFTDDTSVFTNTVPQMAYYLASQRNIDSIYTTMYSFDRRKQSFLPKYIFTLAKRDTTKSYDYEPLLQALVERGLLHTDTTYEPLLVLEMYDSARFAAKQRQDAERNFFTISALVIDMLNWERMPVTRSADLDPTLKTKDVRRMDEESPVDSLWLAERGLRVVPDPQGRQMRIIEFDRCKGSI